MSNVRDMSLAAEGEKKIRWCEAHMPLLRAIAEDFEKEKPLAGLRLALSVHMEAKTACLCRVLALGGAEVHATGCNPLSTQDDVAAALAAGGIDVHAHHGASPEEYERDLCAVLEPGPQLIVDDGGDLVRLMHTKFRDKLDGVIGGCEETTTGVRRLLAMQREGTLAFPMVLVNDADCKHLFDNRYGTGQSSWDGIMRTTNLTVAGKVVVIAGYGWCGRGIAMRARGLGARVIVTEVNPVRALEAHMDGYDVMPMAEAAPKGDLFITVTGCKDVIRGEHLAVMRDGAVLCNAGHFNVEIDINALTDMAKDSYEARRNVQAYALPDGRTLYLLAEGRLVNLASGDGHPTEIMDMSFAVQAMSVRWLTEHRDLQPGVYPVPPELDQAIARKEVRALGFEIDELSEEQRRYLNGEAGAED
ncbi:MAG: adenosylhomocysteinase [Eubacteriales bacterium]|nr:adenosylhomocysteinase [Eubacteriales bacterium]